MAGSSVPKVKNICVFGGSSPGKERVFRIRKSSWSGTSWEKDSFSLWGRQPWVNGGVSITVFLRGSQVLGFVPKTLAEWDIIGKTVKEELQVSTMSERLSIMFNHADAFIALPGGLGTLEEIFHISSWAQLNIHKKPIGLWLVLKSAFLSRFYIIILHLKYQSLLN